MKDYIRLHKELYTKETHREFEDRLINAWLLKLFRELYKPYNERK